VAGVGVACNGQDGCGRVVPATVGLQVSQLTATSSPGHAANSEPGSNGGTHTHTHTYLKVLLQRSHWKGRSL
jgi:hypothetical protein